MRVSVPSTAPPSTSGAPAHGSNTVVLSIETALSAAGVQALTEQLQQALPARASHLVLCDVGVIADPDIATIDALARLALAARRAGCTVRLRGACPELRALVALTGLGTILPCAEDSVVEVRWQTEEREEVGGVQEERDPGDPVA